MMKQCPTCQQSFADSAVFCGADGSRLISAGASLPPPLLTAPLTPSETVLLHAESFAPKAGLTDHKVELPQGGDSYSAEPLGRAIVAAAVLANEQVGYIHLQVAERRALLMSRDMFIVTPGRMALRWAPESMEDILYRFAASQPWMKLDDLVYALWQGDFGRSNVWKQAAWIVERGLAARNLLVPAGGMLHTNYRLTDEAAQLIAQHPPDPVLSLIASAQQPPAKWQTLQNDIGLGVLKRTSHMASF